MNISLNILGITENPTITKSGVIVHFAPQKLSLTLIIKLYHMIVKES